MPVPRYQLPTVADPVDAFDVANKQYVDAQVNAVLPGPFAQVVKSVTETKNNDDVSSADSELLASLPIGIYSADYRIFLKSHVDADFRWRIGLESGSASARANITAYQSNAGSTTKGIDADTTFGTDDTIQMILILGKINVTALASVSFSWAQLTSDAGDTSVIDGSSMVIYQS